MNISNHLSQREIILKYILLKIQSQEWAPNSQLPSERWFIIKFNVSKALIASILSDLRKCSLIYSISRKGNFVTNKEFSFLFSSRKNNQSQNVVVQEIESVFTTHELNIIDKILLKNNIKTKLSNCLQNYICYQKEYFSNEKKTKLIMTLVPKLPKLVNEKEVIQESIFKLMSAKEYPLSKKIEFSRNEILKENIFNEQNFENMKPITTFYEMFFDFNDNLLLIVKIFYNSNKEINSYRIFNLI